MLDPETRQRIDTARNILVGKIPNPQAQVEQITIALIYKFMFDMDAESVELSGKPSFFTEKFAKYSWNNLLSKSLGGSDLINLYSDAIQSMTQNQKIPALFRDIFKNAFLPYRDPETLRSFLKIINEFQYDHSERLGDAFEYLLSILGSQGDAGQFRTPRHIIDFMVEIIDPKKNESILDPACGTAGFLISAYKHIIKHNSSAFTPVADEEAYAQKVTSAFEVTSTSIAKYKGDKLTPAEKKRLTESIKGYDISPDMVRLSLVNLYLHGFLDPKISEYDTLTSEEKWNEYFDIILANPPFMSPSGGIRPHKRFSIPANRSEVLFVDYIAEHLTTNGRAAIIVPEGIIFQSGKAYKSLRKMLVENSLLAVISLPAGVFNPYAGVKTSILILDKALSKKTENILFVKIENDGFDLGAQRRANNNSELPVIVTNLRSYIQSLSQGTLFDFNSLSNFLLTSKESIAKNSEFNLSGDRYKKTDAILTKHHLVKIGDVFNTSSGGTPLKKREDYYINGTIPWLKSGEVAQGYIYESEEKITQDALDNSSAKIFPINTVLVAMYGATTGQVGILKIEASTNQAVCGIIPNDKVIPEYLYYVLKSKRDYLISLSSGGAQPNISQKIIRELEIPLPPLEVQKEIVAEIENYQKIIDGSRLIIDNYKPKIDIEPSWPMVALNTVCEINPKKSEISELIDSLEVSFVPMAVINENDIHFKSNEIKQLKEVYNGYTYFRNNDVLLAKVTPCFENGKAGIAANLVNSIGFGSSELYVLRSLENVKPQWLYFNVITNEFRANGKLSMTGTGGLQRVPKDFVASYNIPLPEIAVQEQIISNIENELAIVDRNKELVAIFEQKIKDRIASVWQQ